jgi:hypothetical protein
VDDAGIEVAWLGKRRVIARASIKDAVVFDFQSHRLQRLESSNPEAAETPLATRQTLYVGVAVHCQGGEVMRILMMNRASDEAREKAERVAQRIREVLPA